MEQEKHLVNNLASYFKKKYKTFIIKKLHSHLDEKAFRIKHKVIFEKTRELLYQKQSKKSSLVIFDDGLQEKTINYDLKIVCFNLKLDGNGL